MKCVYIMLGSYEGVSKSFRTGRLAGELQMVQLSATRCSCIAILWGSPENFGAITLCVASRRVFVVVVVVVVISLWLSPETFGYTLVNRWGRGKRIKGYRDLQKENHAISRETAKHISMKVHIIYWLSKKCAMIRPVSGRSPVQILVCMSSTHSNDEEHGKGKGKGKGKGVVVPVL
jgi:hypothetical protein